MRTSVVIVLLCVPASVLAQEIVVQAPAPPQSGTIACEPEMARVTIEIPTGRCAPQMPAPEVVPAPPAAQLAQPTWAYPGYAPQYAAPQQDPERYTPFAQPEQYVERSIRPLWIVGTALWVAMWGADWVLTGFSSPTDEQQGVSFVPLLGPWIQLAMDQGSGSDGMATILIANGIVQAAAFAMLLGGALGRRRARARWPRVELDGLTVRF